MYIQVTYAVGCVCVIYVYADMSHMCMYMYVTYIQIRVIHIDMANSYTCMCTLGLVYIGNIYTSV